MRKLVMILVVLLLMSSWTTLLRAEIINGGFEAGNLDGWYYGWYHGVVRVSPGNEWNPEGQYYAELDALCGSSPQYPPSYALLERTFSAEAGEIVAFDWNAFVVAQGFYEADNVSWLAEARVSAVLFEVGNEYASQWNLGLYAQAGDNGVPAYQSTGGWVSEYLYPIDHTGTYTLRFRAETRLDWSRFGSPREPPAPETHAYVSIDNVRLIPEPATMALLGLGGLSLLRRKRSKP